MSIIKIGGKIKNRNLFDDGCLLRSGRGRAWRAPFDWWPLRLQQVIGWPFQILAGYRSKRHLAPIIFTLLYPLMRGRSFKWFKYIKLRAIKTRPKNSGNKMEGKGIVKGVSRMDGWNFFMKNAAHNLLMVRRWGNGTKKFYALQEKKKEKSEDEKLWQIGGGVCCYTLKGERSLPPKREKRREGIWSLTRGDLSCNILENGAALERRSPHTKIISARPTIFSTCKKKRKATTGRIQALLCVQWPPSSAPLTRVIRQRWKGAYIRSSLSLRESLGDGLYQIP